MKYPVVRHATGRYVPGDYESNVSDRTMMEAGVWYPRWQADALEAVAQMLDAYRANPMEHVHIRALLDSCASGGLLDEALGS